LKGGSCKLPPSNKPDSGLELKPLKRTQEDVYIVFLLQPHIKNSLSGSLFELSSKRVQKKSLCHRPNYKAAYLKQTDPAGNKVHIIYRQIYATSHKFEHSILCWL